jgi:hypothetical protein
VIQPNRIISAAALFAVAFLVTALPFERSGWDVVEP